MDPRAQRGKRKTRPAHRRPKLRPRLNWIRFNSTKKIKWNKKVFVVWHSHGLHHYAGIQTSDKRGLHIADKKTETRRRRNAIWNSMRAGLAVCSSMSAVIERCAADSISNDRVTITTTNSRWRVNSLIGRHETFESRLLSIVRQHKGQFACLAHIQRGNGEQSARKSSATLPVFRLKFSLSSLSSRAYRHPLRRTSKFPTFAEELNQPLWLSRVVYWRSGRERMGKITQQARRNCSQSSRAKKERKEMKLIASLIFFTSPLRRKRCRATVCVWADSKYGLKALFARNRLFLGFSAIFASSNEA